MKVRCASCPDRADTMRCSFTSCPGRADTMFNPFASCPDRADTDVFGLSSWKNGFEAGLHLDTHSRPQRFHDQAELGFVVLVRDLMLVERVDLDLLFRRHVVVRCED